MQYFSKFGVKYCCNLLKNNNNRCVINSFQLLQENQLQVRSKWDIRKDAFEKHRIFLYDRDHGQRTSCDIVPQQFYRLHWGAWIRTRMGNDDLEMKRNYRRRRLRQHVFCNAKQCSTLDKLTSPWFKKKHYWVDDPYEPYHEREEFLYTRRKPLPPS